MQQQRAGLGGPILSPASGGYRLALLEIGFLTQAREEKKGMDLGFRLGPT